MNVVSVIIQESCNKLDDGTDHLCGRLERRSGHMTPATPHQDSGQIPVYPPWLVKHDMVMPNASGFPTMVQPKPKAYSNPGRCPIQQLKSPYCAVSLRNPPKKWRVTSQVPVDNSTAASTRIRYRRPQLLWGELAAPLLRVDLTTCTV